MSHQGPKSESPLDSTSLYMRCEVNFYWAAGGVLVVAFLM